MYWWKVADYDTEIFPTYHQFRTALVAWLLAYRGADDVIMAFVVNYNDQHSWANCRVGFLDNHYYVRDRCLPYRGIRQGATTALALLTNLLAIVGLSDCELQYNSRQLVLRDCQTRLGQLPHDLVRYIISDYIT